MTVFFQPSFAGGELAPELSSRVDLAKYQIGARRIENFVCMPHGGITRRPGTEWVGSVASPARLIPFIFKSTDTYILVFTDLKMRIVRNGGFVADNDDNVVEVVTPYLEADLDGIQFTQTADTMYLAHRNYAPQKLTRFDHDEWTLEPLALGTDAAPPVVSGGAWDPNSSASASANVNVSYCVAAVLDNGDMSLPGATFTVAQPHSTKWERGDKLPIWFYDAAISAVDTGAEPLYSLSLMLGEGTSGYIKIQLSGTFNYVFAVGDSITFAGLGGATQMNGNAYTVRRRYTSGWPNYQRTYELDLTGTGISEWTSGGTAQKVTANYVAEITTGTAHGFEKDERVTFIGLGGTAELNYQTYEVLEVTGANSFTIDVGAVVLTAYTSGGTVTRFAKQYDVFKQQNGSWGWIGTSRWPTMEAPTLATPKTVATASIANPCVITTTTAHGFTTGNSVQLDGITYTPDEGITFPDHPASGKSWGITVTGTNTFTIPLDTTGLGFEGSGGTATKVDVSVAADDLLFFDKNYDPDFSKSVQEAYDPFDGGDYPATVAIHEQRLWFAGSPKYPQTLWASRLGSFANFNKAVPLYSDDMLELTLNSTEINAVRWLASFGDLLLGTEGAEWKIGTPDGMGLAPENMVARTQSLWGSASDLPPLSVGSSVLHVQAKGRNVRDIFQSVESGGYQGSDLSIYASHLFASATITAWAYQRSPHSIIWCVLSTGAVAALTYHKEHQVLAWSRHTFSGTVTDVAAIPGEKYDDVYFVVSRDGAYHVERLFDFWDGVDIEEALFLEGAIEPTVAGTTASGLDHLEGREVFAMLDGAMAGPFTVTGGEIELPATPTTCWVGINFTSALRTLSYEGDASIGRTRTMHEVALKFKHSVGGKIGWSLGGQLDPLKYTPENYDSPILPDETSEYLMKVPSNYGTDGSFYLIQDQPLPMTLLALLPRVKVGDR